ncbi:hypothetical protein ABIE80_005060 [Bradyrhizobium diazoefficiens]
MPDGIARAAEHQGARRLEEAQHVDHRVLDIGGSDPDRAILDIGVTAFVARDLDPERLLLILLGQRDDAARKGRREQQGAARLRRGLEDELHVLAKAEIEHLVGLVEDDGLQFGDVETATAQMIAQPARRADDDVRAGRQLALLAPRIHAADTGDDAPVSMLVQPGQFALNLQGKLAGRRHDQGERRARPLEPLDAIKQILGQGQSVSEGLAGAGLGRDQEVAACGLLGEHGELNGGRTVVVALGQSSGERRTHSRE